MEYEQDRDDDFYLREDWQVFDEAGKLLETGTPEYLRVRWGHAFTKVRDPEGREHPMIEAAKAGMLIRSWYVERSHGARTTVLCRGTQDQCRAVYEEVAKRLKPGAGCVALMHPRGFPVDQRARAGFRPIADPDVDVDSETPKNFEFAEIPPEPTDDQIAESVQKVMSDTESEHPPEHPPDPPKKQIDTSGNEVVPPGSVPPPRSVPST